MQYTDTLPGIFRCRPNRFIAKIFIRGREETVHVKNTGRCRELLPEGARVYCQKSSNPARKTAFDLIAVEKGQRLINMDSQAPNRVAREWLEAGGFGSIQNLKPESRFGESRLDFSFEKDGKTWFLEVKGVTLENDGICAFPDAPTQRGTRHLQALQAALSQGYGAAVLFVIQMADVRCLRPNVATDPAFAQALTEAAARGVEILAYDCLVSPDSLCLNAPVPVVLPPAE